MRWKPSAIPSIWIKEVKAMKKTMFSKGIYVETLRRLRIFAIIALALMLIVQIAPFLFSVFEYVSQYNWYMSELEMADGIKHDALLPPEPIIVNFSQIFMALPVTALAATPIMVLLAFSVFNRRDSSDFYHALPYTRICFFISTVAAVFTYVATISIICGAVGLAGYGLLPNVFTIVTDGALDLLFSYLALFMLTAGATALAMSATGTILSNISVTLLILFLPRFIIAVMTMWVSNNSSFLVFNELGISFLSNNINILFGSVVNLFFYGEPMNLANNAVADLYTFVLGLLYLIAALFVFRARKSETATCPAPGRAIQHIIRIMLSMVVGIFATMMLVDGEVAIFVILFLLTAVVYFAYELITTRRWKNCLRALPFFGVVVGLCATCLAVVLCIPALASLYTPEPEEIDSVRFINSSGRHNSWYGIEAQKLDITDENIIEKISDGIEDNMKVFHKEGYLGEYHYNETIDDTAYSEPVSYGVSQVVAIKHGIFTKYRKVYFTSDDYNSILSDLEKNEKYMEACKILPKPAIGSLNFGIYDSKVNYSYYEEVFQCLQKEINEMPFEDWYYIAHNGPHGVNEFNLDYYADSFDAVNVYLQISAIDFPKTFEMLLETDRIGREDKMKEISEIAGLDLENGGNIWYLHCDGIVFMTDEKTSERKYYNIYAFLERNSKGDYEWQEPLHFDAVKAIFEYAKESEKEPSAKNYVQLSYSYESEEKYFQGYIYLPVPEDFDPEAYALEEIYTEDEIKYYYK